MATIETNLSQSPYFDDYDETKNYHKVLFKPSVSVQTRELNELQSILLKQVERFGDAIYKRGTIISGCGFTYFNKYPYAKILDSETDNTNSIPALYYGKFAKNSANLQAYVVNYQDGYESSDPDLKTLYFSYINSGNTGTLNAFSAGDVLTIFDSNNSLYSVTIDNGSLGFSNTDTVVITPAIAVNVSSGVWSNGDYMLIPATGANLEVVVADELTLADKNQVLLYVKPRDTDLANGLANSIMWTLVQDADIQDPSATVSAKIENIFGVGASANISTFATGKVSNVNILSGGEGYIYAPELTIRSVNNASGIASLDITAKNYYAKVQIASVSNAVGEGYAFGVGEGMIWQKGNFVRVEPQTVIVDKYSNQPNNVVVGFDTREEIINSNIDPDLLDNVLGTRNETAPGADRLKLTPYLKVMDSYEAAANNDFFVLTEWNEGLPYKQNQITSYSRIGDEMAKRQFDSTGNFVVDTFQVSTASPSDIAYEGRYYSATIDPGQAYISGYKVQTRRNYNINVIKGIDTSIGNTIVSLNYGNYVRIKEVAGTFLYSTGDEVSLRDTAQQYITNWAGASMSHPGNELGVARARSLILENGVPGVGNTVYRLFLFDIKMNPGKKFEDVRAISYAGASANAVGDVVTDIDPTTGAVIAKLEGKNNNKLLFKSGVESLKNSNTTNYIYRTMDQDTSFANTGLLSKDISANPNEFYPYSGSLTDSQMKELYIVPTSNSLIAYQNSTGTATVTSGSNVVTGLSTNFFADLEVGDYIQVYESAVNNDIARVTSIVNATSLTVDANFAFSNGTGVPYYRTFPRYVPMPFGSRDGLTANVDVNRQVLTLNVGFTLAGTANVTTSSGVNIRRENVTSAAKTPYRNRYVKIQVSNNAGGTTGPWCLGVSDIFRLRRVFVYSTSAVNTDSKDVTSDFYIDHNQTANYLDLGWLYKSPQGKYSVGSGDFLLCEFDYFVKSSAGYVDTVSYLGTSNATLVQNNESQDISNLTSFASYWEIPEVYTAKDEYYDLINNFDFRPSVAATATPNTAHANAPINPPNTKSFGNTADPNNDAKFPYPDGVMSSQVEQYLGRIDHICIGAEKGNIFVIKGIPAADPRKRYEPNHPKDALKLQVLAVPPYPNLPKYLSATQGEIISTGLYNERAMNLRAKKCTVTPLLSTEDMQLSQPMVYTMEDIGNLERRIRDLEYYVNLSQLETSITNKTIPSSVDRTLNRFKYGFIADDFSTDLYSDKENPQYAATRIVEGDFTYGQFKSPVVEDQTDEKGAETKSVFSNAKISKKMTYRIYPPMFHWMSKHWTDNDDYTDYLIAEQINATNTASQCEVGVFSGSNGTYGHYTVSADFFQTNTRTDYVVFGANSGTATLYFYNYGGGDKFDIYQGDTLLASTNASANIVTTLTDADKAFLSTNTVAKAFYQEGLSGVDLNKDFVRDTSNADFVMYGGKLTFTHNPSSALTFDANSGKLRKNIPGASAGARSYKIVTNKGSGSTAYRFLLRYPQGTSEAEMTVNPCAPPPITVYNGTMNVPVRQQWSCSKLLQVTSSWFDSIYIYCTGLKPLTRHYFYLDGLENGEDVKPYGGKRGDPLITDKYGKLTCAMYIDETWFEKIKGPNGQYMFWAKKKWATEAVFGSTGYTLFEIATLGSSASQLVANRAPKKLLK